MNESSLRAQLDNLEALRSSLHSSFRFWEWMVVIGVALEFIVLVVEYWDEWQAFWRATIRLPEKPKTWLYLIGFCGVAMVAIGIGKELGVDSRIEGIETQIRQANEQLFGIVSKEAEHASTVSDQVGLRADRIQGRLDVASDQLSGVEADVLSQGPRWRLLDLGRKEFIKSLKPFAKQKSTVVTCGLGDSERMPFEQLIMDLLRKSDWATPGYRSWRGCPTMLSGGNEMYFASASATRTQWVVGYSCTNKSFAVPVSEDTAKAGKALCDVLTKLRISTMAWIEAPIHSPQTREQEIARANTFFSPLAVGSENDPDNPAGLAVREPDTVFILVGPSQPMFEKRKRGKTAPK